MANAYLMIQYKHRVVLVESPNLVVGRPLQHLLQDLPPHIGQRHRVPILTKRHFNEKKLGGKRTQNVFKTNKHWHPPPWCSPTCAWWRQTSLQPSIYVKNYICCLCHISYRFKLTQHLWSLPRCQPRRFSHHWTWAWWQTSSGCWVVSEDVFLFQMALTIWK